MKMHIQVGQPEFPHCKGSVKSEEPAGNGVYSKNDHHRVDAQLGHAVDNSPLDWRPSRYGPVPVHEWFVTYSKKLSTELEIKY